MTHTRNGPEPDSTTRHEPIDDLPAPSHWLLRVLDGQTVRSVPLRGDGVFVLGRSSQADVSIDAPSVSRQHARLHVGRTLQIEDLGSANGTRVRGVALWEGQRVDVLPGDEILVGKVLCLVQGAARFSPPPRLRTLRTHDYFEARLADECAGASGGFAVLRLRVDGGADASFESALMDATTPAEVVAWYAPGEYEVLLPGASNAAERGDQLVAELGRSRWRARAGVAAFPWDGRTPDALIERAGAALRPAASSDGARTSGAFVVEDAAVRGLHGLLARVAPSDFAVLLLGEMGTGKEVFASQLHALSPRSSGPFCKLNCAAFAETLVESELFGHEKGAFTGAERARVGLLEAADGGTVFLDEVGELSPSLQAKLLRVLEDKKVRRVGGREERAVNVRFVAATNRDLERAVEEGRFRGDLLFRLNGFPIEIPPLRKRVGEVAPLAKHFLAVAAAQVRRPRAPTLTEQAVALLTQYHWPGNIRELRNVMERALILADGDVIGPEHLPAKINAAATRAAPMTVPPREGALTPEAVRPLKEVVDEAERDYARKVLMEACGGNQTLAAKLLCISRGKMVSLVERHNLPRPRGGV